METTEQRTREQVMERDQYRCILCFKKGIQVHEIVPRSAFGKLEADILFDVKNRVCLCPECHSEAHTIQMRVLLIKLLQQNFGYNYTEKAYKKYL